MQVVIATPLFPPDIGGCAGYVKELVGRIADEYDVTVVLYGRMPEPVTGVQFITVDKRRPRLVRLAAFTLALFRAGRSADVFYLENGPSVELPALIVSFFRRTPIILHVGDRAAYDRTRAHPLSALLLRWLHRRAADVVFDTPKPRPEILPFSKPPQRALAEYDASWNDHVTFLANTFSAYARA